MSSAGRAIGCRDLSMLQIGYWYADDSIVRGTPRPNPLCQRKVQRQPMDGALLAAVSLTRIPKSKNFRLRPASDSLIYSR
jgi:hypothetical protein